MVKKKVTGKTLFGDERKYTFNLINAKNGTRIFHEYVAILVQLLPEGLDLSKMGEDGLSIDIKQIVADLEVVLPFEKLATLAKALLAGGCVEINNQKFEIDEDGFGDYALGDPLEVYTALLYAIKVNYPKYIDPLFGPLEDSQGDLDSNSQKVKSLDPK